jgi:hypothetical protein
MENGDGVTVRDADNLTGEGLWRIGGQRKGADDDDG